MLEPRLLRHALEHTTIDRVLFSTDHPFPHVDAAAIDRFFAAIPGPHDRAQVAAGNATRLFGLSPVDDPSA